LPVYWVISHHFEGAKTLGVEYKHYESSDCKKFTASEAVFTELKLSETKKQKTEIIRTKKKYVTDFRVKKPKLIRIQLSLIEGKKISNQWQKNIM